MTAQPVYILGAGMHPWGKWGRNFVEYGVHAARAALADAGADTGTLTVRVPGGDVVVTITAATSYLRGPSVLVAHGEIADAWWSALA